MIERIKFEDLERKANYLAKVYGCNAEDIFTKDEIESAKQNGYIDVLMY